MPRRCAHFLPVCLVCAATLGGHFVVARKLEWRRDQTVDASQAFHLSTAVERRGAFDEADFDGMICIDPPSPDEVMAALPDDVLDSRAEPRLLTTLEYQVPAADADVPADAARPAGADEPHVPARPLSRRQRDEQAAVRAVIDEELSDSSTEEREIWFEELKSLPAEVVRDLLQVRRQMRILSPDQLLSGPGRLTPAEPLRPREVRAEPVTQSRSLTNADWSASRNALQAAIDWSTHNIANAESFGYKRVEVILTDTHGLGYSIEPASERTVLSGGGCWLPMVRLDVSQGELVETGRMLDIAIDGPGFLVLGDVDKPHQAYSRRGVITLDAERRLNLICAKESLALQPVMTVPADMASIEIAADGTVSVTSRGSDTPAILGKLQLAAFTDATQLLPAGNGTYLAPPSMQPQLVAPGDFGASVIRQGFLEASNVDVETEVALRERQEAILELMPHQEHPRTADGADRIPQ